MRFKTYKGGDLKGKFEVTKKIDGVQVFIHDVSLSSKSPFGEYLATSKNGKDLKSITKFLQKFPLGYFRSGYYEFYRDSWNESVSLIKNSRRQHEILASDLYKINGRVDRRLLCDIWIDPSETKIRDELAKHVADGYEGLVLRKLNSGQLIKVKPSVTYDLMVLRSLEGTKKSNANMLGAVETSMGRVSAGFTKDQRIEFWKDPTFLGSIIEVAAMGVTKNKKLRHPRFIRRRFDKDIENTEDE